MAVLRITQHKSANGARPEHRDTLRTLGLGKIGSTSERAEDPRVSGALRSVRHLVRVESSG